MRNNIKDIFTTIAGILGAISAAIVGVYGVLTQYAITMPVWIIVVGACCGVVSIVVIGYFNGRNADGSAKTVNQAEWQQKAKVTPPPIE